MPDIDEIRRRLQDRVATVVSEATGINRNTVAAIKSGSKKTASKSTLIALAKYLGVKE